MSTRTDYRKAQGTLYRLRTIMNTLEMEVRRLEEKLGGDLKVETPCDKCKHRPTLRQEEKEQ